MQQPLLTAIAARSKNNVIGLDGQLPWHISQDLKFFKQQTLNKPMIMGRKTRDSFGVKPLPKRPHIVVTHDQNYSAEGSDICHSIDQALNIARQKAYETHQDEICLVGGGTLYQQMLPMVDRIILSEVALEVLGDAFFPEFDIADFSKQILHDYSDLPTPFQIVQYDRLR